MRNKMRVLLYFLSGCIGIIIGVYLSNYRYFTLDKNISLSDLLTLAVTSFIGIYIGYALQNKINNLRGEKEFLIDEIKEFKNELQKAKKITDSGSILFNEAVTLYKDLNHRIMHLKDLHQLTHFVTNADFSVIRSEFNKIRNLITGRSPNPVTGMIAIPPEIKSDVDKRIELIKKELYKLIIKINHKN